MNGSRQLVLVSTTAALLIGIWVAAYLTVWTPAMSSVGPGIAVYGSGDRDRCLAPARTIISSFRPLPTVALEFDIYTDDEAPGSTGPGNRVPRATTS